MAGLLKKLLDTRDLLTVGNSHRELWGTKLPAHGHVRVPEHHLAVILGPGGEVKLLGWMIVQTAPSE